MTVDRVGKGNGRGMTGELVLLTTKIKEKQK